MRLWLAHMEMRICPEDFAARSLRKVVCLVAIVAIIISNRCSPDGARWPEQGQWDNALQSVCLHDVRTDICRV